MFIKIVAKPGGHDCISGDVGDGGARGECPFPIDENDGFPKDDCQTCISRVT